MATKRILGLSAALAASIGCGGPVSLQDGRHPTGSQAMVASKDFQALYVAHPDDGTLIRYATGDRTTAVVKVGGEATRVARANDRVYVTLRDARAIAIVRDDGGSMTVEGTMSVGAEPYGIVANEAGTRLYVASSLSGIVQEIDPKNTTILRTWTVPDEPRWLALRPDGQTLYVGSAMKGTLSRIDLSSSEGSVDQLPLPNVSGGASKGNPEVPAAHALSPRITGDLAVTPDGTKLLVPTIYVDNRSTVVENPGGSKFGVSSGGYTPGRFNPVLVEANLEGDGTLSTKDRVMIRILAGASASYPASVTASPDSKVAFLSIEGSGAVVAVSLQATQKPSPSILNAIFGGSGPSPGSFFELRPFVAVGVAAGPRAIAVLDERRAFAFALIDHKIDQINLEQVTPQVVPHQSSGAVPAPSVRVGGNSQGFNISAVQSDAIASESFPDDVARGRRLFYATNNKAMSGAQVGLSCATCHFEGRTDGLTWSFQRGGRQTPSLAGKISLTQPVRWEGDSPTVADDAFDTSQNLMGGVGLARSDADAIQAFIDHGRDVDVPLKGSTDEHVANGKAIFERAEVGCSGCHNGARMTNNQVVSMFGLSSVKVRSLVGVASTPPYLHDGSEATLKGVVLGSRNGEMGNTSSLSDQEIDDLVLYLESL